jgi:PAS domain S-box-containing protein
VLLADVAQPNPFSGDAYFARRQPKSVLCLPIVRQTTLIGLLYLENRLVTQAFTPERVTVLELLASQAAISLENALLYADLREREARIRRLVESNIIGIFFWDLDGNITDANDALLQIIGYSRQELLSGHVQWTSMTPAAYRAADVRAIEELEQTGTCIPYEKEYIRKDGSRVPILHGAAFFEKSQENGVAFVLELTERKQAEAALRKAHEELEERVLERTSELAQRSQDLARSNAELEQMAYVASHDLQEPLRMVASYMQLLEEKYRDRLDADAHEFIAFAVDGATRMQALIDDLLSYSRVGSKAKPLQPIDCTAVVETALRSLRMALEESGAQVECGPLPVVMGDAAQLAQLFQNLMANAIKFHGDQPPEIHIHAEPEDGFWRFAVRDNGIGIAPDYFERIFVMFQRLHSRSRYPGTGIGLAICKKIVERHGGRIWVESAPGQGTTFLFTLPRKTRESH